MIVGCHAQFTFLQEPQKHISTLGLSVCMINIYIILISQIRSEFSDLYEQMPFSRKIKINNFKFESDKLRCLGAGLLLQSKLGITSDEMLCYSKNGKPMLKNIGTGSQKTYFNISHSGDYVALAVSEEIVGIDIEEVKPYDKTLADFCFDSDEIQYINESPECFYELWTKKESIMKATGLGLSLPPKSFSLHPVTNNFCEVNEVKWHLSTQHLAPNYPISVTSPSLVEKIKIKYLSTN